MSSFKPMVKMMTDEPSVILKLKKGGKVAHKAMGGYMPMASTQGAAMPEGMPMGMPARGGMAPSAAPMKPSMAMRRRAMMAAKPAMNPTMMKKGGKADDMSQDKAMIKKAFKQHDMQEHMGGKGTSLKLKKGGMMSGGMACADGGEIDKFDTKTTIKSNAGKYAKTKMDTAKKDSAHGTGVVKMGKPGGYAMGGTIEGNEKAYKNTKMVTSKRDTASGTGGVKMGNGGGYAKGGNVDWENRPADTAKPGKVNTTTGGVKNGNGGGFKMGGSTKKAYATGGTVDTGKPVAMPRKPVSRPIANSLQSGTFKKGGNVKRYEDGDRVIASETARMNAEKEAERKENEGMRDMILGAPRRALESVKGMFGSTPKPAGSVTKTEKSVTVAPGRKRGGSAMC